MIRLLLDATAVLAYCRGSVAVGETIGEVADSGHQFGVVTASLAEASVHLQPDQVPMLTVLVRHYWCHPPMDGLVGGWQHQVQAARLYGSFERGRVGLAAAGQSAYILTACPEAYKSLPTIAI